MAIPNIPESDSDAFSLDASDDSHLDDCEVAWDADPLLILIAREERSDDDHFDQPLH